MPGTAAAGMPVVDLFSPEARNDPYPAYRILQDHAPAYWCEPLQGWMLTRFADVSDAQVTLDANHPLAGQDLTLELQLVEVATGSK